MGLGSGVPTPWATKEGLAKGGVADWGVGGDSSAMTYGQSPQEPEINNNNNNNNNNANNANNAHTTNNQTSNINNQ